MARETDGGRDHIPSRRFRFDDWPVPLSTASTSGQGSQVLGRGHSGRRFVLVCAGIIFFLWFALACGFRVWEIRYEMLRVFGEREVAPVILPLARIMPPGVNAEAWQQAVRDTHAMLITVLSANLLDRPRMEKLRDELTQLVERSRLHPETAVQELGCLWTAMAVRAEFLLQEGTSGRRKGHPRPAILPPQPVITRSRDPIGS
jgi:hypothetical protein